MTYAHDEAIEFLKDANREYYMKRMYNEGSYALAAYLANIAKSLFTVCRNPTGVELCDEIIDLVDYHIKGTSMVNLLKKKITPTRERVLRETIKSREFGELEALVSG